MEEKRPIDRLRESGGQADIGTEEDGAIVEMKNIGGRLLIIKERSIYELIMADTVDPERTNIDIPNDIHKLIINQGAESETVSRTLLTALGLFRPEYIIETVDCGKVISLAIDLLSELSVLEKEITEYLTAESEVAQEYEERRQQKCSYKLPSVINLETTCKTIFQKANHIEQTLIDIFKEFYPTLGFTKQSHFPLVQEKLQTFYGETDPFVIFLSKIVYFMQVIYELRNGFDHRLDYAKAYNFELQLDGNVLSPTIELTHKKIKLERTSLSDFLKISLTNMLDIIELAFAHLASKNLRKSSLQHQIRLVPEDKRRNKFVRYSLWTPLGPGGFYNQ